MVKCEICKKKAMSMIRGIDTCRNCFYLLKKDNQRRSNEVVKDLKILRECIKCHKRELQEIIYARTIDGLEIKPYYCKDC